MEQNTGSKISLPSFRDGIEFDIKPLRYGATKAVGAEGAKENGDPSNMMLLETLKRDFPNVEQSELDNLDQEDFLLLFDLIGKANDGLTKLGFSQQNPDDTETSAQP